MLKNNINPGPFAYIDHISPIVIITIDYLMNRIPFSMRHFPLSLFILLVYGVVNITKTLVTGEPVYAPLNFHDVMSFVWSTVLLLLEFLGYKMFYHITQKKLAHIRRTDFKQGSNMTVFDISVLD